MKINHFQSVQLFGNKIILFKDIYNRTHVFDAYCPYQGIDICVIGSIDLNSQIVCTFNGWKFSENGVLSSIGNLSNFFEKY